MYNFLSLQQKMRKHMKNMLSTQKLLKFPAL